MFDTYPLPTETHDEMFAAPGQLRPAWRPLVEGLQAIGPEELSRRCDRAHEDMREEGVTYVALPDESALQRPWQLDILPMVLDADQWRELAAGLIQRMKLMNIILADLYGPQDLLRSGRLPAAWLFDHPGYQPRLHGMHQGDGKFLTLYAADLARGIDGRWWIVGDRTDAPLGLGYALENRVTTSRMLPRLIRQCAAQRHAHFFIALQQALRQLAPQRRDNPRIVLLSPGPEGPSYFEDAYLARYLGYTLVEGGDLAVRGDHVFLKTLSGLLPVDVIWRRVSDALVDPLEVRTSSNQGIPGLLQALRMGNVAVINAPGAAVVESASLMQHLPGVARHLLGEDLLLPSVETFGVAPSAPDASQALLVRAAYRVARKESPKPMLLDQRRGIPARDVVLQQQIPRSTMPIHLGGRAEPFRVALRAFVVISQGSFRVLPGGLVRLASEGITLDRSILAGDISKDAWVIADGPVQHASLLPTSRAPIVLRRSGADVPSRVADNLFWFGRRIERAQGACRLMLPIVAILIGEDELDEAPQLGTLVRCLVANGLIQPGFALGALREVLPTLAQALPPAALDPHHRGSLRATFDQAMGNASMVRDRLSMVSWRIVHRIGRRLAEATAPGEPRQPSYELVELDELLNDLVVEFAALDGLFYESMTRSPAWRFLELGRRLERSLYTVSLVQALLETPTDQMAKSLENLLRVADSLMTYRSRYLADVHWAATLDLLLTDDTNPRSLLFQIMAIADHVTHLPKDDSQPLGTSEERITLSIIQAIKMLDVEELSARQEPQRGRLERTLQRVADQLPRLSDLISHHYLIHAGRPRQMSEGQR